MTHHPHDDGAAGWVGVQVAGPSGLEPAKDRDMVKELGGLDSLARGRVDDGPAALAMRGLSKVFPGTQALKGVDLTVRYGEVHALCGGNGCGKSTLIKILAGALPPDRGTVTVGGREVEAAELTGELAYDLGVRVVHQDPPLYLDLSVAENMMLGGKYPTKASKRIAWSDVDNQAKALIDRFEIQAKPQTLMRDLPVSARTQVAIATALQDVSKGPCIVALDEPTAALPAAEVKLLLATIRQLAGMGHAIIFVSHRLDEVLAVTDRVTVMRDGQVHKEHASATLTEAELIESILGRPADEVRGTKAAGAAGHEVLSVKNLTAGPLQSVSLDVRAGEVLGVAGLLGSGRTELLSAICGALNRSSGDVTLLGKKANFRRIDQAIDAGVFLIPEDRSRGATFPDMTVDENMDISVLARYRRWVGFRRTRMRNDASALRKRFRVKAPSGEVAMRTLSGGNQQKTIIARWLRLDAKLLLLDEPSQGVDVGARADIYTAIRSTTDAGGAAIVVASDLEELALFADRAVVLHNGRMVAEVPGSELTAHRLSELVYMQSGVKK